jgi:hypothetical protein
MKKPSVFRLGKLPVKRDPRTLQLANYLRPEALPPAPPSIQWGDKVPKWALFANDRVGDCTCAAAGHLIMDWTANDSPKMVTPSDKEILATYSAITGYDPKTGANDTGAYALDVLNHWRKKGVAKRKILAYAALEPGNQGHVKDALYLFGGCYLGLSLPITAQGQKVWSVPPGGAQGEGMPGSWGGHAVSIVGYDPRGLSVVTWGAVKHMTWGFMDAYCDEAYAVLSGDWTGADRRAPNGVDLKALREDLIAVTGRG